MALYKFRFDSLPHSIIVECIEQTMAEWDQVGDCMGLSRNFVNYPAKANYPDYSNHQCMVARHLTLEVGATCMCFENN